MRVAVNVKVTRRILRGAQYFLVVAGVSALGYCGFDLGNAWFYQANQSHSFDVARENGPPKMFTEMPENAAVLGRLQIPRLGLAVMIVEGVDENDLARAAGHIPGTTWPEKRGNVGIAGHRDTFFRPLHNIRRNDTIQLTTLHGSYKYRVVSTSIVDPSDVRVLRATSQDTLTLVTCYPFYFIGAAPKRFIVRAARSDG